MRPIGCLSVLMIIMLCVAPIAAQAKENLEGSLIIRLLAHAKGMHKHKDGIKVFEDSYWGTGTKTIKSWVVPYEEKELILQAMQYFCDNVPEQSRARDLHRIAIQSTIKSLEGHNRGESKSVDLIVSRNLSGLNKLLKDIRNVTYFIECDLSHGMDEFVTMFDSDNN